MTGTFTVSLPNQESINFGYALIRDQRIQLAGPPIRSCPSLYEAFTSWMAASIAG